MASVAPMPLETMPTVKVDGGDNASPVKKVATASPSSSPSKWAAFRQALFAPQTHGKAIDISTLPPDLRAALSELDTDGSGSLEVAELHSAVQLLKASREAARRAHLYIMILLTLLAVLLAALFGVSFAAAVLAATTKGANGSLQDTNGNTLRVAGSAISSVNLGFQAAGAGARRLAEHSGPVPQEYFAHRRTKMTIQDGNGRRLSVTGPVENPHDVKPLILLATVKGSVAIEVCRFAKEGHFNVVLPSFDPYEDGLERAVASFKVNSMVGCAELDHSFGFAGDFGVVLRLGSEESIFHLDCPGPVTPDSDCSVYRAFLIIQPSSGAPTLDVSFARNETFNITSDGELSVPAGIAVGRRLGPGEWPPSSSIGLDVSESACPTLKDESNWPSRSGYGLDSETAWKNALLNELNVDPNATPAQQARLLCQTSVYCMVGYAVGSGAVFHPSFWTSTASAAEAMGKYIANDFKGTLSLNNQKALWASFKKDNAHKCTTTVSSATCLNMNSILVLKGINDYTCKQWNVQDFKAGAIEIAHSCANSCEMLQWYSSWWRNYRVGSYDTRYPVPNVFDGSKYTFVQDYCGTTTIVKDSPKNTYYGGVKDTGGNAQYQQNPPYTTHSKCWVGKKIPLCRSFKIITKTTC